MFAQENEMTRLFATGAAVALTALAPISPAASNPAPYSHALSVDHALRVDHHSGPVDARYRGGENRRKRRDMQR